jgi:CheY-like chemotaxis protein
MAKSLAVLLVEDEFLVSMDLQEMLERWGHRVIGPAATVDQALEALRLHAPDVVLLDANLQGKWSTPVASALRARRVPYIVISAYENPVLQAAGLLVDGSVNLGKPIFEDVLASALAGLQPSDV